MLPSGRIRGPHVASGEDHGMRSDRCGVDHFGGTKEPCLQRRSKGVIGCLLTGPRVKALQNCMSSQLGTNSGESFGYQVMPGLRVMISLA